MHIQAKAEQEEEFISNTLLKKIQALKKEKESLALNYEQEEECLTNDLSRKLNQLRSLIDLIYVILPHFVNFALIFLCFVSIIRMVFLSFSII